MAKLQATSESDSQHALETQCIQLLVEKARAEGGGTRQQVRAAARRFVRRHRRNRSYLRKVLRAVVASSALAVTLLGLGVDVMPASAASAGTVLTGSRQHSPSESQAPLTEAQREAIWTRLRANRAALQKSGALLGHAEMAAVVPPTLILPLAPKAGYTDPGFFAISGFVDHDPAVPDQLLDYDCGSRTYDLSDPYNHSGTDYYPWPFAWELMDSDSVEIVAAAAGTIIGKDEPPGNYDRNCDWDNIIGPGWNAVYIEHADGSVAWYGHMKNGSLTAKSVGAAVALGEKLGTVGSSGFSSGPHLHFELYSDSAETILVDPYAGACNATAAIPTWASQPPYRDSEINRLMTASGPPTWPGDSCTNDPDVSKNAFFPGDPIYFTALFRDELPAQASVFTIYRPDNSVHATYTHTATQTLPYGSSWVSIQEAIPSSPQAGTWRVEVDYESVNYSHNFTVSGSGGSGGSGPGFWEPFETENALYGEDIGLISAPALGDLDNDGDLDMVTGDYYNSLTYYENTGTASVAAFVTQSITFSAFPAGYYSHPALGDLDDDGDLDIIAGEYDGYFHYYENTGSAASPSFALANNPPNPMDGFYVGTYKSAPTMGDLDADGDLDLISGDHYGNFHYYENTGSAASAAFTQRFGASNPLDGENVGTYSAPHLGDVDGDGDLDVLIGEYGGKFFYYENTGSPATAVFTARTGSSNPLDGKDVGWMATPTLGDMDADSDLDLISGEYYGNFKYFEYVPEPAMLVQLAVGVVGLAGLHSRRRRR
jgi:hypothetical protein